ncbi:MAG TPA: DUF1223 domain-containing protein [Polyangiaceae bacterium]
MRRIALVGFLAVSAPVQADAPRVPVVVELFSSEGCSSCPPADELLARLDRDQPIGGAEVIALEMHVDYWNQLGWRDPFSQPTFTARQRMHAYFMGTRSVYTPEMVVDGRDELVGSNAAGARAAIARAAHAPHVAVKLARSGDSIAIDVGPAPASEAVCHAMLATTERGLSTRVTAGENSGETLEHGPIVRTLRYVADLDAAGLHTSVQEPAKPGTRVVVFVESRDSLHVLGAATL